MNTSVVNVLTPNGRRQNVKVLPNTAILKVFHKKKFKNLQNFSFIYQYYEIQGA